MVLFSPPSARYTVGSTPGTVTACPVAQVSWGASTRCSAEHGTRVRVECMAGRSQRHNRSLILPFSVVDSIRALSAAVVVLVTGAALAEEVVYFENGSVWRYLPGTSEASAPDPTAWRQPGFDDGDWGVGAAPIGFGTGGPFGVDLGDLDPPMSGNYSSLFLRTKFTIEDVDQIQAFVARVSFDDGFMLWINGTYVTDANVPSVDGEFVPHDETATRSHSGRTVEEIPIEEPKTFLVDGENTIAAQVFNVTLTSSDLKFELELADPLGPDLSPPQVTRLIPVPGTTIRALTDIEVVFDEEVVGLDAADLLINDAPATELKREGLGPWLFSFPAPPNGAVSVRWAPNAGITDTAPARNAFQGGEWTYTVDPDAPLPDVVITEILASSGVTFVDEDGDNSDWIEIFNQGSQPVDITSWALSNDPDVPDQWVFPEVVLQPRKFLVIFASGKDRREPGEELHTNFRLGSEGEFLGLFNADVPRAVVSAFAPEYPPQRTDHSYGLSPQGQLGYFGTPTPGADNAEARAYKGFVADPLFSVRRGVYDEPFRLTIRSSPADATIFYTLDGTDPSPENGTTYDGPIEISPPADRGLVAVRAIALHEDLLPSRIVTHSYIFPEAVLSQSARPEGYPPTWPGTSADYAVDPRVVSADREGALDGLVSIPTVSLVADSASFFDARLGIYVNASRSGELWERAVSAELIYPDGRPGFQIDCGARMQGGSSVNNWKSKKLSLKLLFKGDYGAKKLRFQVFPDTEADEFDFLILDASLNLVWHHPSADQQNQAQYVRDQFVADLQNESGGLAPHGRFVHLYLNGLYWGQYGLHERPDASFAAEHLGGDKRDYVAIKHQASPGRVVDGNPTLVSQDFNVMLNAGRAAIDPTRYAALPEVLDVAGYANYMIINFWVGNTDWMHQNWYATRRMQPTGPWLFHSWDAEHVLKNAGDNLLGESRGPAAVFQALRRNPEFATLVGDILHRHFFNGGIFHVDPASPAWDPENPDLNRPAALYMQRVEEVRSAIHMESARWGDVNRSGRPYMHSDWARELNRLIATYFPRRSDTVLRQFVGARLYPGVAAPVFSRHGGEIAPGFILEMSVPADAGTIHYTLDGTDPRRAGGDISETAVEYAGPVALDDLAIVSARTRDGDTWSALNDATFTISGSTPGSLLVSEIMYNPEGGADSEFIELHNPTSYAIDVSGVSFSNGIEFVFPPRSRIAAGGHAVLVANREAFRARYPDAPIDGVYSGRLANGGEKLTLRDASGATILSIDFNDGDLWPVAPDGFGFSLVLADPQRDPDDQRAWRASARSGGSPGAEDPPATSGGVVINEVLGAGVGGVGGSFVELLNVSEQPVDIGGWFLSPRRDTVEALKSARIESGNVVPPGGFVIIAGADLDAPIESGKGLWLTAADAGGEITGHIDGVEFDPSVQGVPFGRHETSTRIDFTALSTATRGAPNADPMTPPVAINEIHYNPLPGESEFVELHNPGAAPIDIGGWELRGVFTPGSLTGFVFDVGTSVPAGGFLLVVPLDPAAFRLAYDVPGSVPVLGPYAGALDNSGERLRLLRPSARGVPADVMIDMVRFNDRAPWPLVADGDGRSLERISAADYGNEALNWGASRLVGGTPGRANSVGTTGESGRQLPGDTNQDQRLNMTDAIALLGHLFLTTPEFLPCGDGTVADEGNRLLLDANGDLAVNLTDGIHMLNYLFLAGAPHVLGTDCVPIVGCPDLCRP